MELEWAQARSDGLKNRTIAWFYNNVIGKRIQTGPTVCTSATGWGSSWAVLEPASCALLHVSIPPHPCPPARSIPTSPLITPAACPGQGGGLVHFFPQDSLMQKELFFAMASKTMVWGFFPMSVSTCSEFLFRRSIFLGINYICWLQKVRNTAEEQRGGISQKISSSKETLNFTFWLPVL